MTAVEVLDIARLALLTLLKVAGPVMLAGLAIGVTVALFQTLTQLQEMTLTFIPKILVVMGVLLFTMPYIGGQMGELMAAIVNSITSSGGS